MQVYRLQQLLVTRKSLIAQLAAIKGEDMTNRVRQSCLPWMVVAIVLLQVMSMKDKLLSTTSPVVQNPVPQSNTKPLAVVSSSSQLTTKASTTSTPVTNTISVTTKPSSQVSDSGGHELTGTQVYTEGCYYYQQW